MNSRPAIAWLSNTFGKKYLVFLLAVPIVLILRLSFIGLMGLMPQDAYYHFYGEHLALSYFDHPPAIAYLLRLFTDIFGEKVFAVKLADTVVSMLMLLAFYHLAKCFLSLHKVFIACLLLFSTLMFTTLSLVSTPDVPLMLFWTLSLFMLYQAIFREKKWCWIWAGIAMGLAFDSKYTGLFLPAGLVLFLLLSPNHRRLFASGWFWLCAVIFIATIFPVFWWNWQNNFASFRFQTEGRVHSMGGVKISVKGFFGVLGHQSAILMPILFFALGWLVFKGIKKYTRRHVSAEQVFLYSFFLPVFVLFLGISFFYWVKLNWMMPAYISGIILLSNYMSKKWVRFQLLFSVVVHLIMAVEIVFYLVPVRSDDTWFGWDQLANKVKALEIRYPKSFVFAADDYKTSAILNFYSDSMIYSKNVIGENALQFDYIGTNLNLLRGRDAIFINSIPRFTDNAKENQLPEGLTKYFDRISELDPILIGGTGGTKRKFLVFYCRNYHPQVLVPRIVTGN
jgi:4-amino-4-deoxy-L-arabinose transferase-like glycosyltransferase